MTRHFLRTCKTEGEAIQCSREGRVENSKIVLIAEQMIAIYQFII